VVLLVRHGEPRWYTDPGPQTASKSAFGSPRGDSTKRSSKSRAGCAELGSKSERGEGQQGVLNSEGNLSGEGRQVRVYQVRMDHGEDEAEHRDGEAQMMISDKAHGEPFS
jgi:hypothetical protein